MKTKLFLLLAAMLVLASPMFAQVPEAPIPPNTHWIWIASGFSMAFASALCALAQARAVAASAEGMARNPSAAGSIRFALIFGLVLIESLALYTLVIIIVQIRP